MDEAEPERTEQSGGVLGGEDLGAKGHGGGVPAEPSLSEQEEGGRTHDSSGASGLVPGARLLHTNSRISLCFFPQDGPVDLPPLPA